MFFSLVIPISTGVSVHRTSHTAILEVELTLANFIKKFVKHVACETTWFKTLPKPWYGLVEVRDLKVKIYYLQNK